MKLLIWISSLCLVLGCVKNPIKDGSKKNTEDQTTAQKSEETEEATDTPKAGKKSKSKSQASKEEGKETSPEEKSLESATSVNDCGNVTDAQITALVGEARGKISEEDAPYIQFVTLHHLQTEGLNEQDIDIARIGLSKTFNVTARFAPKVVNPKVVDGSCSFVYHFDTRDYWGFAYNAGDITPDSANAERIWNMVQTGFYSPANLFPVAKADIKRLNKEVIKVDQLVYNLSHPTLYNRVMELPDFWSNLVNQLGADFSQGIDSGQWLTVNTAIVKSPRLTFRLNFSQEVEDKIVASGGMAGNFVYATSDLFNPADEFIYYNTPIPVLGGGIFQPAQYKVDQVADSASEIIFSMPNGMHGFYIAGQQDQRRERAECLFVEDPLSTFEPTPDDAFPTSAGCSKVLVNGLSCHSCHASGLHQAPSDMATMLYEERNYTFDEATADRARALYPDNETLAKIYQNDNTRYQAALKAIVSEMTVSGDQDFIESMEQGFREPIVFLTKHLQSKGGK